MISAKLAAAFAAVAAAFGFAVSANAAPLPSGTVKDGLSTTSGLAREVDIRDRRCFWRNGVRHCPRVGFRDGRRFGARPGVRLYFGSRDRDWDRRRRWR